MATGGPSFSLLRRAKRTRCRSRPASSGNCLCHQGGSSAVARVPPTVPSHAPILTGAHPARRGVRTNDGFRLGDAIPTLPERLRGGGYATAAFVGAFPLLRGTGLARGFDGLVDIVERRRDRVARRVQIKGCHTTTAYEFT